MNPHIFYRIPKIFFRKSYQFSSTNPDFLQKYQSVAKLLQKGSYNDALRNLSEIIEANPKLKGSATYNSLLQSQVSCYYHLRQYSEAENNCLNMVEFTKYNIKAQNIELSKSTLFQEYAKLLEIFIYSGNEKVFTLCS